MNFDILGERPRTPTTQQMLEYADANPVPFTVDAIKAAAQAATGLPSFGPDEDALTERMQLWVETGAQTDRTNLARMAMFGLMTKFLGNRMRVYDFLAKHPEVEDIEIKQPVMVIGLPRSGTSHLVNLLAADSRFRAAPIWELNQPVPGLGQGAGPDGMDPRYAATAANWERSTAMNPYIHIWHPMQPYRIEEDIEIHAQDFSGYYPEQLYQHAEQWRDYYLAHDQTPHYEYQKKVMQIMTYFRPREQWVTKYPAHIENIPALLNVFPDAVLVETHRDPVGAVQSMATMHTYVAGHMRHDADPSHMLNYWQDTCARLLNTGLRDRPLAADQVVDVAYRPFVEDNWYAIGQVYDKLGIEITDQARQEIQGFIDNNRQGNSGRIVYHLERDFGVSPQQVREPFAEYMATYDIPVEVR